jgi:hypothetical protein
MTVSTICRFETAPAGRRQNQKERATMTERDLKERAARLGCKVRRRGNEFHLTTDGGGCMSSDLSVINDWLDVIEHKIQLQVSTACGVPLFKINAPDG